MRFKKQAANGRHPSAIVPTPFKKRLIFSSIIVLIVAVIVVITLSTWHPSSDKGPTYNTLLPAGKTITQLGGWVRVSPPNTSAIFAYADKIGSVPIKVSEQPVPDSFAQDPTTKINELAKSYNATDTFMAGDTTIHLGTSLKGPQSLIAVKNNLLILITSQQAVDDSQWKTYITDLQ